MATVIVIVSPDILFRFTHIYYIGPTFTPTRERNGLPLYSTLTASVV
jgi:hypothetical protein